MITVYVFLAIAALFLLSMMFGSSSLSGSVVGFLLFQLALVAAFISFLVHLGTVYIPQIHITFGG